MTKKPPGKCIFCEGTSLTKEHLFADWLRELFPRTSKDTHTYGTITSWEPKPVFSGHVVQGHSGSKRIRKVCRTCNSGWISGIDERAKQAVTPLIKGDSIVVADEAQLTIATWLAKISMVGDSIQPYKSVVLQSERKWIKDKREPPPLWEVWLGSYGGNMWRDLAIFQHSGRLNLSAVTGPGNFSGYVETTTIGIGKMLALVIGNENAALPLNIGNAAAVLKRIWPISNAFTWPRIHILSDNEAGGISHILRSAIVNPIRIES